MDDEIEAIKVGIKELVKSLREQVYDLNCKVAILESTVIDLRNQIIMKG